MSARKRKPSVVDALSFAVDCLGVAMVFAASSALVLAFCWLCCAGSGYSWE